MQDCPMCTKWNDEEDLRVAELEYCYVVLNRDQFFPGYCFVFTKAHVVELFHLERATRSAVMEEVNAVASALSDLLHPTKINYELLGNKTPHMHWHVVPRFEDDALWPRPLWSEPHEKVLLAPEEYAHLTRQLRKRLGR